MMEARWPDCDDIIFPNLLTIDSGSYDSGTKIAEINDTAISQPTSYWVGAIFHGAWSYTANTGTVTSSASGTLTVQLDTPAGHTYNMPGAPYYLTGCYNALDQAGEWYYDSNTSTLYLWAPGGGDPSSEAVEAKGGCPIGS
jgi:hypothetical protein